MSLSPDLATIQDAVRQLIISVSNIKTLKAAEIGDDQLLFDGSLGLDSIDLLELVIALQRKYGIKLKNDAAGQQALRCVASLSTAVADYLTNSETNAMGEAAPTGGAAATAALT